MNPLFLTTTTDRDITVFAQNVVTVTRYKGFTRLSLANGEAVEVKEDISTVLDLFQAIANDDKDAAASGFDYGMYVTKADLAKIDFVTSASVNKAMSGLSERLTEIVSDIPERLEALETATATPADTGLVERVAVLEELVAGSATPATDDEKEAGKA